MPLNLKSSSSVNKPRRKLLKRYADGKAFKQMAIKSQLKESNKLLIDSTKVNEVHSSEASTKSTKILNSLKNGLMDQGLSNSFCKRDKQLINSHSKVSKEIDSRDIDEVSNRIVTKESKTPLAENSEMQNFKEVIPVESKDNLIRLSRKTKSNSETSKLREAVESQLKKIVIVSKDRKVTSFHSKASSSKCNELTCSPSKVSNELTSNLVELDKINEESVSEDSHQQPDPSPKVHVRIKDTWQPSERDDSQILGA